MKIPKYIQKLIDQRYNLAQRLAEVSFKLDEWIDDNNICVSEDAYRTGVLIYTEPFAAQKIVESAILEHKS